MAEPADSEVLLARATSGDGTALRSLLERHLPALRFYVSVKAAADLKRRESDSDLVQSVCLEVLENPGAFEYRGESEFRHWLYTAALRKLVEKDRYHAAAKRDHERLEALPPESGHADVLNSIAGGAATPSRIAAAKETLGRLEAALRQMPDDLREIILLSRLMGFSHAEIAARLGKTEGSVRTALCRGLAKIAHVLAE